MNSLCSSIAVNPFNDNEIIATFSNYGVISVLHTLNANSATPPTWDAIEGPASGDCHVRFCERLGLKCACLLDASITVSPTSTTTYYVRYKGNCNTSNCISKTVVVSTPSVGGTVSPATKSGCGLTTVTLTLSGFNGTVTRWERQTDCTGPWTSIDLAGLTTVTVKTPNSSTCYRAIVTNGACPEAISSIATITIEKPAVGGRVTLQSNQTATSLAICPSQNAVLIPLGFTGKVTSWQYSFGTSSIWYDLPNSSNQLTITVNGSTVTSTTFYRAVITTVGGICTGASSVAYSSSFRITKKAGCSSPDGSLVNADSPLTVLSAFPNPTKDVFILEIENNIEGAAQIEIMDIAGRMVLRTQQSIEKGFNTLTLNVQNLSSGLYLVRIKDSNNQEAIVKMSKL